MKNNATNLRIDEMHFDRLTLVFGEYAGKAHAPVNPAATIVAVKGGPVKNPITSALAGALESLGLARKSAPALTDAAAAAVAATSGAPVVEATKASADEAIENAGISALFSLLYNLECDTCSIVCAGLEDDAKKAAVTALVVSFYEAALSIIGSIFGEKSMVVGADGKPSADAVKAKVAVLDGVIAQATKARDVFAAIEAPPPSVEPLAAEPSKVEGEQPPAGEKSTTVETKVEPPDIGAQIVEAFKSLDIDGKIATAVKAAVDPLQAKLDATTTRAEAAEAQAADAKKALDTATEDARGRQAPGGHQDPNEASKSGESEAAASADVAQAAAAAPTILDAIKILHNTAK